MLNVTFNNKQKYLMPRASQSDIKENFEFYAKSLIFVAGKIWTEN